MKTINVAELQGNVSHYLALAEDEDILITKDGKPIGVLRGFTDEEDLVEYTVENHPLFRERVRRAREEFRAGKGVRLEAIKDELLNTPDPE